MPDHKSYNTPLLKKIGVQAGQLNLIKGAPGNVIQLLKDEGIRYAVRADPQTRYHLIWIFTNRVETMESELNALKRQLIPEGMIWVSWFKKSSGLASELTEDVIRETALALDLVDIKVASVDASWSALKLVVPLSKR